jgi:hypothetical protein
VPVIALLTRSMLTAEPGAARACVAVARGPARAQLATLLVAFAGGLVLGLAGAGYELATNGHHTAQLMSFLAGLGKALVCVLVGSAVGTLFNPPLIRHAAAALLSTMGAVVVALVSSVSPASAALRGNGATVQAAAWPAGRLAAGRRRRARCGSVGSVVLAGRTAWGDELTGGAPMVGWAGSQRRSPGYMG